jgi:hypothetical protein
VNHGGANPRPRSRAARRSPFAGAIGTTEQAPRSEHATPPGRTGDPARRLQRLPPLAPFGTVSAPGCASRERPGAHTRARSSRAAQPGYRRPARRVQRSCSPPALRSIWLSAAPGPASRELILVHTLADACASPVDARPRAPRAHHATWGVSPRKTRGPFIFNGFVRTLMGRARCTAPPGARRQRFHTIRASRVNHSLPRMPNASSRAAPGSRLPASSAREGQAPEACWRRRARRCGANRRPLEPRRVPARTIRSATTPAGI